MFAMRKIKQILFVERGQTDAEMERERVKGGKTKRERERERGS